MRAQRVGRMMRPGTCRPVVLGMALAIGILLIGRAAAAQYGAQHSTGGSTSTSGSPSTSTTQPGLVQPDGLDGRVGDPGLLAHMEAERLKAANDDRHKKLVADVERLISLANELKTDVDKTDKDELSVTVVRKAQEIEKLAHDVQNRMKN